MIRQSKTTLKELTAQYRSILKKCAFLNAMVLMSAAFAAPADAAQPTPFNAAIGWNGAELQGIDPTDDINYSFTDGKIKINASGWENSKYGVFTNMYVQCNQATGKCTNEYTYQTATIDGSSFLNNTSTNAAGALTLWHDGRNIPSVENFIRNSIFENNKSEKKGGAVALLMGGSNVLTGLATFENVKFNTNSNNKWGGALYSENNAITIKDNSEFKGNSSLNGGAIYLDKTSSLTVSDSTFTGNKALFSVTDASTYKKEGVGGAIASSGQLTVNNSTFTGNTALSTGTGYGLGGAISTNTVDGNASTVTVNGSKFSENKADVGGAIYGMLYKTHQQDYSTIAIENSVFNKNEAKYTGSAIANFDAMTITNSDFSGNKVFENVAGETDGGTLFLGSDSKTSVVGSSFNNNSSATVGGAIATRTFGDNSQAKLDITNTTFEGNIATTNGGAIDNYFYHSNTNANGVTIADSAFTANQAANGGAIYNHSEGGQSGKILLTNINFEENIAMTKGGAIYNDGTMTFKGHALFSGNTANGELNDIHNDGNIIFWGDANITLDGGISGAGFIQFSDKTTLNAKLNTTTILADTVQFDGNNIINLTVENGLDNGDYKFISGSIEGKDETTISENSLYNLSWSETTDGYITLAKKTTSEVVAGLAKEGVNAQQAAAISAFADSTAGNPILSSITEAVQSGKAKAATKLVEEIAPTTSQTVIGIAQEVNNILNNVAGVRMAAVGRSGGDAFVGGSVWAQGLMNHTKQNSTDNNAGFSADTAGVSFGIDGKITNDLMIGVGYGYTNTNADSGSRDIDVEGHNIFAYTEYKPNNWYINGMFSYGINKYEETKIANLDAKYDVNTYAANVMTGYDFDSGITPEVGVRYLLADQKSYNDGLQNISADNNDVLTGVAGFKYKADMKANNWTFAPNLRLAATYDMISDDSIANVSVIGGGNYQITGESLERLGVEAGIGLETTYKDWTFSIDYNGGFRKDFQSHTGMLKAKYNF